MFDFKSAWSKKLLGHGSREIGRACSSSQSFPIFHNSVIYAGGPALICRGEKQIRRAGRFVSRARPRDKRIIAGFPRNRRSSAPGRVQGSAIAQETRFPKNQERNVSPTSLETRLFQTSHSGITFLSPRYYFPLFSAGRTENREGKGKFSNEIKSFECICTFIERG